MILFSKRRRSVQIREKTFTMQGINQIHNKMNVTASAGVVPSQLSTQTLSVSQASTASLRSASHPVGPPQGTSSPHIPHQSTSHPGASPQITSQPGVPPQPTSWTGILPQNASFPSLTSQNTSGTQEIHVCQAPQTKTSHLNSQASSTISPHFSRHPVTPSS